MALSSGGHLQVLQLRQMLHWAAAVEGRMRALAVVPPLVLRQRFGDLRHGESARHQARNSSRSVSLQRSTRPFHCGRRGGPATGGIGRMTKP